MTDLIKDLINKLGFDLDLNTPQKVFLVGVVGFIAFTIFVSIILGMTYSAAVAGGFFALIGSLIFYIMAMPAVNYVSEEIDEVLSFVLFLLFGTIIVIGSQIGMLVGASKGDLPIIAILYPGLVYFALTWALTSAHWMINNYSRIFTK